METRNEAKRQHRLQEKQAKIDQRNLEKEIKEYEQKQAILAAKREEAAARRRQLNDELKLKLSKERKKAKAARASREAARAERESRRLAEYLVSENLSEMG